MKFSPDFSFSRIALTCNKSDISMTQELKVIIPLYADVTIDNGDIVCDRRDPMGKKYSKLPGISEIFFSSSILSPMCSLLRPGSSVTWV